jgi:hypothetical protein
MPQDAIVMDAQSLRDIKSSTATSSVSRFSTPVRLEPAGRHRRHGMEARKMVCLPRPRQVKINQDRTAPSFNGRTRPD